MDKPFETMNWGNFVLIFTLASSLCSHWNDCLPPT